MTMFDHSLRGRLCVLVVCILVLGACSSPELDVRAAADGLPRDESEQVLWDGTPDDVFAATDVLDLVVVHTVSASLYRDAELRTLICAYTLGRAGAERTVLRARGLTDDEIDVVIEALRDPATVDVQTFLEGAFVPRTHVGRELRELRARDDLMEFLAADQVAQAAAPPGLPRPVAPNQLDDVQVEDWVRATAAATVLAGSETLSKLILTAEVDENRVVTVDRLDAEVTADFADLIEGQPAVAFVVLADRPFFQAVLARVWEDLAEVRRLAERS